MSYQTIVQALDDKGLNFNPIKVDVNYHIPGTDISKGCPDHQAVLRDDTNEYLGLVGRNRSVVPYRESLNFAQDLISNEMLLSEVYSTRSGARIFLLFTGQSRIQLSKGDELINMVRLEDSHDSSRELQIHVTPIRNSNGSILSTNVNPIRFMHKSKLRTNLNIAQATLSKVSAGFQRFGQSLAELVEIKMGEEDIKSYIELIIGEVENTKRENSMEEILRTYNRGVSLAFPLYRGTLLGIYFAVVEWAEKCGVKASKKLNRRDAVIESMFIGSIAKRKLLAYTRAIEYAKKWGKIAV